MKSIRNSRVFKVLAAGGLLVPLLQGAGCVFDPNQFAAFLSSQFFQLASRGFQNAVGEILDRIILNSI